MPALIIEASTEQGVVGIIDSKGPLIAKALPYGFQQSKHLVTSIAEALDEAHLEVGALDYIGLGVGPGSYTGIRVAAAIAEGMAYGCQLPIVSFSSLQAFVPTHDGTFAVLFDAKMGGIYAIKGIKQNNTITYTSAPTVYPLDQIVPVLLGVNYLVTPNKTRLSEYISSLGCAWNWEEPPPSLENIWMLVQDKFEKQEVNLNGKVDLLYLRDTPYKKN